jgi:hypothetical protein
MTKFADRLYADLTREHGPAQAAASPPAAPRRHLASRRVLLGAGAGALAAAATAVALAAGGSTPAYALTTHPNGTVTIAVYRASGIAQVNAKLSQVGDNVVVVPVQPGCPAIGSLPPPAVAPDGPMTVWATGSSDGSITVNGQGIPDGDIMVVGVETTTQGTKMAGQLTSPPPPSCVSLPASSGSGNGS